MKKRMAVTLCTIVALSLSAKAFAAEPMVISPGSETQTPVEKSMSGYALQIDGKDTGVRACIMVPLRAAAEKLGFTVTWNADGTVLLDDGSMNSVVTIGVDCYQVTTSNPDLVGMSAPFSLGVPPYTINGVTYVPLGLFDALLGSCQGAVTMDNGAICLDTDPLKDSVQIPNPFVEQENLEKAVQAAGFEWTVPDAVDGSDCRVFRAINGEFLEIIYYKGENETARIRKALDSELISGDYTVYSQVDTVIVNGCDVAMSGSNDKVSLATWRNGGYTYAVSVAGGISHSEMTALVSAIQ